MPTVKYYQSIENAQKADAGKEPAPNFDLHDLGSGGIVAKVLSSHLFWAFLRTWWPIVRIGRFGLATRYDDVMELRKRDDVFEAPFRLEMTELAGGSNFVLGMRGGPEHERQKKHILAAFHASDIDKIIVPTAARVAETLVSSFAGRIDAVQDLLMRVSAETCITYFGLDVEDQQAFADWVMSISTLLFGDPFGDATARRLALTGARNVRVVIARSIEQAKQGHISADTLMGRLVAMQKSDPDGPTDGEITAMLMGLAVGFIPTDTLASGHILEVLFDIPEAMAQASAAALKNDDARLERCLMEAMRFKPPIIPGLPRYALKTTTLGKGWWRRKKIPQGTTIIGATMSAMLDPRRVAHPKRFDPDRQQDGDLLFGGRDFLHYCLGEHIARAQITQAFKPLLRQKQLKRAKGKAGKLVKVGPFPRHMEVTFEASAGQRDHAMITICVPMLKRVPALTVQEEIAKLGNPSLPPMRAALDKTERIHFASIAAIDGDAKAGEPSYLVFEMSVDGPEDSAIDAIVETAGPLLLPIFRLACGTRSQRALSSVLHKHVIHLKSRPRDPSGLNFCGTPELPVTQIERERKIAAAAHAHLAKWLGHHAQFGTLAMSALRFVRQELRKDDMAWALVQPVSLEPAVSKRADRGIWEAVKSLLEERAFVTWLGLAILAVGSVHFMLARDTAWLFDWTGLAFGEAVYRALAIAWDAVNSLLKGALYLAVAATAVVAGLVWLLRRQEKSDEVHDFDPLHADVDKLLKLENPPGYAQNHITAITPLKPGRLRRLTLALSFWGIEKLVQHRFRPGFVLDIGTIHYARWLRLPKTNKLVFFSNYDGSWESYLEDFITKAHYGQTAVWSNGAGFPKTKYLVFDGADDGKRFKRWVRRQQVPTRFWYTRFPELTTDQIRNNSLISYGLANARTDSSARAWIDLFNSQPRPRESLEAHEIQSLMFGGMGKLASAELIALRFPAAPDQSRAWLREIMNLEGHSHAPPGLSGQGAPVRLVSGVSDYQAVRSVTFGDVLAESEAMIVAFSAGGLRHLGLDKMGVDANADALASFPAAFVEGMGSENRARILGDAGESAPGNWQWGNPKNVPDAVLLLYAKDRATFDTVRQRELASLHKHGLAVAHTIPMGDHPSAIEPFGFKDSVSQPIIRGTRRFHMGYNPIHVMAPGEFVLGYPDNRGQFPLTPVVAADKDRDCCLATMPDVLPDRFPSFDDDHSVVTRDFGRNGSYLVIRQLEEDAAGFDGFLQKTVDDLKTRYQGLDVSKEWVGAKMIGRWKNGSSLARNPNKPGEEPDNDFLFGVDDPQGLCCPFGAHIRRANPRDSLNPGSQEQLDISNRHRLLRVGRPYFDGADGAGRGGPKGLVFMCFNADIERQFEFIQQTWLTSPSFHGLRDQVDPVAVPHRDMRTGATFTIPTSAGPIELQDLQSFVRVRGGGYFFLPSRSTLRFLCRRP